MAAYATTMILVLAVSIVLTDVVNMWATACADRQFDMSDAPVKQTIYKISTIVLLLVILSVVLRMQ